MNRSHHDKGQKPTSRRHFLKRSAAAGLLAVPSLFPAGALGKDGKVAPSERILLGGIGLGGRGPE